MVSSSFPQPTDSARDLIHIGKFTQYKFFVGQIAVGKFTTEFTTKRPQNANGGEHQNGKSPEQVLKTGIPELLMNMCKHGQTVAHGFPKPLIPVQFRVGVPT